MALLQTRTNLFNQTTLTSGWASSVTGGMTLSYDATGASIIFPASSTINELGQVYTTTNYDLTGSYAYMQVLSTSNSATIFQNGLQLFTNADSSYWVAMVVQDSTLFALKRTGGATTNIASVTYNSTTHKYWRIRESAGTTYWDYSSDGSSWTNLASQANPITVTSLRVSIYGQSFSSGVSFGTFKFNNFNVIPSASNNGGLMLFYP